MAKNYKTRAKEIVEEAKKDLDSPQEGSSAEDWVAYALKKEDEAGETPVSQESLDFRLVDLVVAELFMTFDERSLNLILDAIERQRRREDREKLDFAITKEQAEVIGKIISQRFPSNQKEYLLKSLVAAKNTKKPPIRSYKKPTAKKCPVCGSTRFRTLQTDVPQVGIISEKICEKCGYKHTITKDDIFS